MAKKRPRNTQTVGRKIIKEASKLDVKKALCLRIENNMTYDQIAKQLGVTRQAVFKSLKPLMRLMDNPEATAAYRDNRAEFMDSVERVLASHLVDKDKLKAASVNNIAYAVSQINNIGRLERGQSTQNVAVVAGLSPEDREWLQNLCSQFAQRQLGLNAPQEEVSDGVEQ